ncbi:hypothetical protein JAAARDRAFT_300363 [Jaapia argillacea MUCL 33604]|uniref:MYND-type domain-containing protein n=1 Tax=Jaapia argillacea MUCL 33604 TaxID=933084 RepID=A0A067PPN8_9AGAM|nr:hypothetical protein JAAARDRAFT_300363 [Jaapia argillacea MUCL 33604]
MISGEDHPTIEALLLPASNGSVRALHFLCQHVAQSTLPPSTEITSIFIRQLQTNAIPNPTLPSSERLVGIVYQCLNGIFWSWRFSEISQILRASISAAWPSIWKWTRFLGYHCILVPKLCTAEDRKSIHTCVAGLLRPLACDDSLCVQMASTPGFFDLLVRIWFEEANCPERLDTSHTVASALSFCISPRDDQPDWINDVLKIAVFISGGDSKRLATAILDHMQFELRQTPPNLRNLVDHTLFLSHFGSHMHRETSGLRSLLPSLGSISVVMQTLVLATSKPYSTKTAGVVRDLLFYSTFYLDSAFKTTEGVNWVCQALERQLLPALLRAQPWLAELSESSQDEVLWLLERDLPCYMIHRPVVQAVERSLEVIQHLGLEKNCPTVFPRMQNAWNVLKIILEERSMIKSRLDTQKQSYRNCYNKKCLKVDEKHNFKQCTKCIHAHYCSRPCQIEDWKNGDHKAFCTATQELRRKGKLDGMPRRDADFVNAVVSHDAKTNFDHIVSLMFSTYPTYSPSSLIARFDYTTFPLSIAVGRPSDFPETADVEDIEASRRFDCKLEEFHKGGGETCSLFVRAKICDGGYTIESGHSCRWPRGRPMADIQRGLFMQMFEGLVLGEVEVEVVYDA